MKKILLALVATFLLAGSVAHAQNVTSYSKSADATVGIPIMVYSSYDSVITDGTAVMLDTTTAATTNLDRIVVKKWTGTALSRPLFLGLAWGDIPTKASNSPGRVLIYGYHRNAQVAAGGSANTYIKPGLVIGHLYTAATTDSSALPIGLFIGYRSDGVGGGSRGKVYINHLGAFHNSAIH